MRITGIAIFILALFITSCTNKETGADNKPKAAFSLSGHETPVPSPISFINTSSNATSYQWRFGDGGTSTEFNPVHTYTTAGTFIIWLKVSGPGGTDSVCKLLTVEALPPANKTAFSYYQEKCNGIPVGISFKSLNPSSTNPVWDFGNGSTALQKDPITQYVLPGDYTIKFSTILGGVRDTVVRIIRIEL
jgi:PKD repeat protein